MRLVYKQGWFWRALDWLVRVFTFGRNRTFLTDYVTTIGPVVAVPVGWNPAGLENQPVLVHEAWHVHQQESVGFGSAWVGLVPWGLFWLLFPLPLGLAWGRYVIERSAYAIGFHAELAQIRAEGNDERPRRAQLIDFAVEQLTGASYGWAAALYPGRKRVREWFLSHV